MTINRNGTTRTAASPRYLRIHATQYGRLYQKFPQAVLPARPATSLLKPGIWLRPPGVVRSSTATFSSAAAGPVRTQVSPVFSVISVGGYAYTCTTLSAGTVICTE